jgi:predicted dehydrogenase
MSDDYVCLPSTKLEIWVKRRTFLKQTAATSALASLSPYVFAGSNNAPKKVGLIGSGWYGKCDTLQLLNVADVEVVSVCDVDSKMAKQAAALLGARQKSKKVPKVYEDYRSQLEKHEHDIVIIGTPDHWHSLPMIAAVEAGADVYCQKPTGWDVLESKAMLDAARKHKRVVQIGTQRRSTPHLIEAKQRVVDAGLLGDVAHVEVCCYYHMRNRKTKEQAPDKPAPDHLNWEMYTGPAPMRPYNDIVHPRGWRAFMEYGNGIVGDMCVHMLDLTRWMLDLGWPSRISSAGGILVDTEARANITDTQTATFHYDDMNIVWTHRSWGHAPDNEFPWSAIIYGDKGTLKLSVNKYEFEPRGKGEKLSGDQVIELDKFPTDAVDKEKWSLELHVASAIRGHMTDFLSSIEDRSKPVADIEQGHISSASCILANIAMDVGKTLEWNPETHQVMNSDAANERLMRDWRSPYVHPAAN